LIFSENLLVITHHIDNSYLQVLWQNQIRRSKARSLETICVVEERVKTPGVISEPAV